MTSGETEVRERFRKIAEKAESLGILQLDQLSSLESVQKLRAPRKPWLRHYVLPVAVSWAACLLILGGVLLVEWPVTRRSLVQLYFDWSHMDLEHEQCLVDVADVVMDMVRPPVDCRICRGITSVDVVSKLSPEVFENKYAYSGHPVVVTDATKDWSAIKAFSFDFFKGIYGEDSPVLQPTDPQCQFFPYKTNFKNLAEVFNMSQERAQLKDGAKPWYIGWSNCDSSAANVLRQHYTRPYFLPASAESSKTDWIFMGSKGYGAHMHIDNVGNPSWQAQITGTKIWTLEPPPECYHECVRSIKVTVHPGDIIVLDTNQWFHSTLISSDEMSITIGSEYD